MSDLISRKAVLEEIQKIECEPGYQHVGEDWAVGLIIAENIVESAESIESTPSAEPERRWIPVTDRLPKDNRQVLVYAQSTHFALAKHDEMREADGKYRKQWVTFDAWKPFYTIENVLAWMPLPEPWRGE